MDDGNLVGRYPAVVVSYDQEKRTCRVDIPQIASKDEVYPEAEIEYPIGDKSRLGIWETEIEILPGDTVWVDFIGGDPRYPVITGWRNPRMNNSKDWRRWHHTNINLVGDIDIIIETGKDILIKSGNTVTITTPKLIINAAVEIHGPYVCHDGINIGKSHTHEGTGTPSLC